MNPGLLLDSSSQRIELEHGWEFLPDRGGLLKLSDLSNIHEGWREARAGLSWNTQFEDLRDYMGAAWYRIRVRLHEFSDTRHVLLKFGAVDYFCEVYVNGTLVGSHEGGYTPFSFDVTSALHAGVNQIAVRVVDPPMDEQENRALFPEMMYNEIPHGKQNWYLQNSGIWQGVRLELCPAIYIDRIDVTPHVSGDFRLDIRLLGSGLTAANGAVVAGTTLRVTVHESSGKRVFETSTRLESNNVMVVTGTVRNPRLWSTDDPALYVVEAYLAGEIEYRRRVRFGFRKFEARDGGFYLNDRPFYMIGALDQDFYPETIHTPASEEFVRDMMMKAKSLGINVLRCHLKVAHPVYLDVADELGLLVWAELPSWSDSWFPCDHFSLRAAIRGENMFNEIVTRDWNHPSVVIQTIMNESWGIDLKQPEQRKWLREAFERIKNTLAPVGRLVVDNSPCEGNFHIKSDIDDFHQYYSMPDQAELWDRWVEEFASRPSWTYSPFGDAERSGSEPLVVSEFGNWGLPKLPNELPWWFHSSFGGREITQSTGVLERFEKYGFGTVFETYNQLAEETQWHQFESLKHEIESIRSHGSIQGYVITGMTDVHWEANGLLDMWRTPKIYAEELARLQSDDMMICRFSKTNYFSGQRIEADILLSHYGPHKLAGARIRWSTDSGATGVLMLNDELAPGTVRVVGKISFDAAPTNRVLRERVELELRLANGSRVSETSAEVAVYAQSGLREAKILFHDPLRAAAGLREKLQAAGYALRAGDAPRHTDQLVVATTLDGLVQDHLANGGRALVILDSSEALPADLEWRVVPRAGIDLDGRWFSNYNWVRADAAPFDAIAVKRILGFESMASAPTHVIRNVPAEAFSDVLSGITYGWLNKNSVLAMQVAIDAGKAILTTYRFHEYGSDAFITTLLDSMIAYVQSERCTPRLRLPLSDLASKQESTTV